MAEKDLLIDLEEPLRRLKCGIKALELMIYGLGHTNDPMQTASIRSGTVCGGLRRTFKRW